MQYAFSSRYTFIIHAWIKKQMKQNGFTHTRIYIKCDTIETEYTPATYVPFSVHSKPKYTWNEKKNTEMKQQRTKNLFQGRNLNNITHSLRLGYTSSTLKARTHKSRTNCVCMVGVCAKYRYIAFDRNENLEKAKFMAETRRASTSQKEHK